MARVVTDQEFLRLICPGGLSCGHPYGAHDRSGRCTIKPCRCMNDRTILAAWVANGRRLEWSNALKAYVTSWGQAPVGAPLPGIIGAETLLQQEAVLATTRICTWPRCGEVLQTSEKTCWKCAARGVPVR